MQRKKLRSWIARTALVFSTICLSLAAGACRSSSVTAPDGGLKANAGAKRALGTFTPVRGTAYLMAPITSQGEGEYLKGGYDNVHNHVFFNTVDESTHTLLPSDDYWITETRGLPEKREEAGQQSPVIQWFLYFLVKFDTDGDRKLTYRDNRTLAVSDAGGEGFAEIISDIEQVYGQALRDDKTLLVFYRTKSTKYVARIDLPNKRIVSTKELALPLDDLQ